MTTPKPGATNWTNHIEEAKLRIKNIDTYIAHMEDLHRKLPSSEREEAQYVTKQIVRELLRLQGAVYEIELFGKQAKQERTQND